MCIRDSVSDADGRQLRQEEAQKRQIEPDGLDADAGVAQAEDLGELPLGLGEDVYKRQGLCR